MNYKHIVFDVDGTLLDTAECILYSLKTALQELEGLTYETDDLAFALGSTSLIVLDKLNVKDVQAVLKLWVENEERYGDMIHPFNGMPELLASLKEKGFQLGIVTSRTHEEFDLVFDHLPIRSLFHTVVCSDDTEGHKPHPDPLLMYMKETGTKSQDLLYIGDSPHDSECASNAEVDFALAVWGAHTPGVTAKYYPKSPLDILGLLSE